MFVINADGSVSPKASPELALGLREGAKLVPTMPVAVATAMPA